LVKSDTSATANHRLRHGFAPLTAASSGPLGITGMPELGDYPPAPGLRIKDPGGVGLSLKALQSLAVTPPGAEQPSPEKG